MLAGVVLGTRPEIIKLSPVIRAFSARTIPQILVHTNQHYDPELDEIFFRQLNLPAPDYNLSSGAGAQGRRTGLMAQGVEQAFLDCKPDLVVVQGDTNSTLAGALAAAKLGIPIAHVEAGLRSFDKSMPEENNRVATDHLSRWLFAPTSTSEANLAAEGLSQGVHVVGNTVVDALFAHRAGPGARHAQPGYILVTIHRQRNTENRERLDELIGTLDRFSRTTGLGVRFPIHPRTANRLREFGLTEKLDALPLTTALPALGYGEFHAALRDAQAVLTDSGGVQEEACVLGVPAVTFADRTDRPETVAIGANVLAPTESRAVAELARIVGGDRPSWKQPFGDGNTGQKIVELLYPPE